jgi:hypothetical protein
MDSAGAVPKEWRRRVGGVASPGIDRGAWVLERMTIAIWDEAASPACWLRVVVSTGGLAATRSIVTAWARRVAALR